MLFDLSEEQERLRDEARSFAEAVSKPKELHGKIMFKDTVQCPRVEIDPSFQLASPLGKLSLLEFLRKNDSVDQNQNRVKKRSVQKSAQQVMESGASRPPKTW